MAPVLQEGQQLDGAVLCKLSKDKTIYVQPSCDIIDEHVIDN